MANLEIGKNLIMLLLVVWTLVWKCYSVWTASKKNHKKWFIALIIFNTLGILDIIYIFYIAKKKWSDVKKAFFGIFSVKKQEIK